MVELFQLLNQTKETDDSTKGKVLCYTSESCLIRM